MKQLKILGSGGAQCESCGSMSALADGRVLVDAGTGAFNLSIAEMENVGDVVLTHSHLDHTAMLCFIAECRIDSPNGHGLRVHCLPETADAVRDGLLNNRIWPDFERIKIEDTPLMSFSCFQPWDTIEFGDLRVTPLPVQHADIPTVGFVLHGEKENFVFISDVCVIPEETYDYLAKLKNWRRMCIETSFPEGLETLAENTGHLTPKMLEPIIERLPKDVEVYYCHVKPRYVDKIAAQIQKRFAGRVQPLRPNMTFDF